jgi:hypothetical protein
VSFVGGLLFCVSIQMFSVFNEDEPILFGGVESMYSECGRFLSSFYQFNTLSVFRLADEYNRIPEGWTGRVYEIPLSKTVIGLLLAIYGSVVGTALATLTCALKFAPLLFVANKQYLYLLEQCETFCLLFFFIGWVALNALSPLALAASALFGFACGARCAMEALRSDSIPSGLFEVCDIVLCVCGHTGRYEAQERTPYAPIRAYSIRRRAMCWVDSKPAHGCTEAAELEKGAPNYKERAQQRCRGSFLHIYRLVNDVRTPGKIGFYFLTAEMLRV